MRSYSLLSFACKGHQTEGFKSIGHVFLACGFTYTNQRMLLKRKDTQYAPFVLLKSLQDFCFLCAAKLRILLAQPLLGNSLHRPKGAFLLAPFSY